MAIGICTVAPPLSIIKVSPTSVERLLDMPAHGLTTDRIYRKDIALNHFYTISQAYYGMGQAVLYAKQGDTEDPIARANMRLLAHCENLCSRQEETVSRDGYGLSPICSYDVSSGLP